MLFISKSLMIDDQAAKFAYWLILRINILLYLFVECKNQHFSYHQENHKESSKRMVNWT